MPERLTDFNLPADAYAAFDAHSLKSLIKSRLDSESFFTDQNYEGSNLSSIIDIIAYSYHVLLFYLNQTSTESTFTESELYENINRIVKLVDYKPVGVQTSNLSFNARSKSSLSIGTYTIPRFTFINANGVFYSLKEDVTFSKTVAGDQPLTDFANNNLLYQGQYQEYPLISAKGEDFETITLLPGDDISIDHFTINVFVQDVYSGTWSEYNQVSNLFLEKADTKAFELRLNENRRYDLKFGNGTTSAKLNPGDVVAVYYLKSDGAAGEVGIGAVDGTSLSRYTTSQFLEIFDDVKRLDVSYISQGSLGNVSLSNTSSSTVYYDGETVDDIRSRAPGAFSSQYRLVTKSDYKNHITQNYPNVISDVKVVNNADYLHGHLSYNVNTLKLSKANDEARTMYNQVLFADACDFNNVYIYAVPQTGEQTSASIRRSYLSPGLKNSIINSIRDKKVLTSETIIVDPVYTAVNLGLPVSSDDITKDLADHTKLRIHRDPVSRVNVEEIKDRAYNIITSHFNTLTLGSIIPVSAILSDILNIDGVVDVKTVRTDIDFEQSGINFLVYNPIYSDHDINSISNDLRLPFFKYPYIDDSVNFADKIEVVSQFTSTAVSEY